MIIIEYTATRIQIEVGWYVATEEFSFYIAPAWSEQPAFAL